MKTVDYKSEYAQLCQEFSELPTYEDFNALIELSFLTYDIYDTDMMSRFFRRLAEHRLESYVGVLQNILYPNNSNPVIFEESSKFSEEQKNELYVVLQESMALLRSCNILNLSYDVAKECAKLTELFVFLQEQQQIFTDIYASLEATWKKPVEPSTPLSNYMG